MACAKTAPLPVTLVEILKSCLFFMLVLRVQLQGNEACKFNQRTTYPIRLLGLHHSYVPPQKYRIFLQSAVIALWF